MPGKDNGEPTSTSLTAPPDAKNPSTVISISDGQSLKSEEYHIEVKPTIHDDELEDGVPVIRNGELYYKRRVPGCKGFMFVLVDVSAEKSWEKLLKKSEKDHFVFYDFIEGGQSWLSKYFSPVIARQFYADNMLYLERKFRKVTWDELFVDLTYVAVVRQCANIIEYDNFAAISILQFILIFPAIHHTWIMIHQLINAFNFEFILCRVYLFLMLILVYGMGLNCYNAFDFISVGIKSTTNIFLVCYLMFRVLYNAYYLMASIYMFKFRPYIFTQLGIKFIGMCLIFSAIFFVSGLRRALYIAGYIWDFIGYDLIVPLLQKAFKWKEPAYRIATNVEHNTERLGNFTLIMLGEMVISLLWASGESTLNLAYIATIMGLLIVVVFQSIVFNLDIAHMLRQSVCATLGVHALTLCFHICLVGCSAALDTLTFRSAGEDPEKLELPVDPNHPVDFQVRWVFCAGAAGALVFQTCKTAMERSEPLAWAAQYWDRLIVRSVAVFFIFIVAGWGSLLRPVNLISTISGILLMTLLVDSSLAFVLHREHEAQERESLQSAARGKDYGDGSSIVSRKDGIMEG